MQRQTSYEVDKAKEHRDSLANVSLCSCTEVRILSLSL